MALLNQSLMIYGQLPKIFDTLRGGQAPDKFNREFLKDLGFKSSNHFALIPLMKGLGFLTADGTPTQRYRDFLDPTRAKHVISDAVREAYGDIFVLKAHPTKADKQVIVGKYKSTYNLSELSADRAASTFLALLELCDQTVYGAGEAKTPANSVGSVPPVVANLESIAELPVGEGGFVARVQPPQSIGLHYNIQIHLPATREIDVYNAIFKALREHLID